MSDLKIEPSEERRSARFTVTALAGQDEVVLYLDFDGVLHHENVTWHPKKGAVLHAPLPHRLFQHVDLLEEEIAP